MGGTVAGIHVSAERERLPEPVAEVDVTEEGVRGDRYFGERSAR